MRAVRPVSPAGVQVGVACTAGAPNARRENPSRRTSADWMVLDLTCVSNICIFTLRLAGVQTGFNCHGSYRLKTAADNIS